MARLTKAKVEALRPDEIAWDESLRGFGARCRASGTVYFVKYREAGRQRWYTIGPHGSPWTAETARAKALAVLGLVAKGESPAARRDWEGGLPTLAQFAEHYLEHYARRHKAPGTVREDERNLANHVLPALGAIRIDALATRDVARFHAARHEHPVNANRCLALVSHMCRMAEKWQLRPPHSNPCRDVERYPEEPRERFLSAEELARLGQALAETERSSSLTPVAFAAIRVLMFTGARKSEITTLRWGHVDLARGVARRDTKTGVRNIILPAPALAVLKDVPRVEGSPWVFPGLDPSKPISDVETAWDKARKAAGLDGVRIHDLRHSFASVAAAAGDSLAVIGALLGHKHASTTQRYAHLSPDPLAAAAEATAKRIAAAMAPKPAKKNVRSMAR